MSNSSPLVTIGLPVYNGARHLPRALESLLAQDYGNFELIISDNASVDGTADICAGFARDHRVTLFRNASTVPILDNFNSVLQRATGQYFMWAAHDDTWEPSFVSDLVRTLEARSDAVLAFCRWDNFDEDGRLVAEQQFPWSRLFTGSKYQQLVRLIRSPHPYKGTFIYGLIRRSVLLERGGIRRIKDGYSQEDIVTLVELLAKGEFVVLDEVLFHNTIHRVGVRSRHEPLVSYVFQRIGQRHAAHHANLITFLARNHAYHARLRSFVLNELDLPLPARMGLWTAAITEELLKPLRLLPPAVAREVGLRRA